MENFVVSARKYRPITFDTVVGQQSITNTLKNAIRNQQLAQAFLFCGPRGVGKTTCARILAKTINCLNLSENIEACNECESCKSFNDSASFNIHELDAASNNSVDDIRNLVDQVRVPPQVGEYKVYIIDEVHMLSQAAFNAFLKTLEEPPAYAKFILATTEKHRIIPTILSRCQIFDFKRITVDDIAKHLKFVAESEKVEASDDALHIIAQKADGALRDALSIFDQLVSFAGKELTYESVIQNLNVLDWDYYFRMIDYILAGDASSTLLTINEIVDNGFDGQHFIMGMGEHLRNLLVSKDPSTVELLEVSENLKKRYLDQSMQCNTDFLLRALSINNQFDVQYKTSNNKQLTLELSLLQMCGLQGYPKKNNDERGTKNEERTHDIPKPKVQNSKATASNQQQETKPVPENPGPETVSPTSVSSKQDKVSEEDEAIISHTSIKKASRILNGDGKKKKEIIDEPKNKTPFSQEHLETVWRHAIPQIFKHSGSVRSSLKGRLPVLKDDFQVEITVDNKVIETEIREHLTDLLGFLKAELMNDFIRMDVRLADVKEQQDKAYFPDEIYKKMIEKNPAVKDLRDELDLEIDF